MYSENPLPYEVDNAMNTASPDEIDDAIKQLGGGGQDAGFTDSSMDVVDMEAQDGGMAMNNIAMTDEMGGMLANGNSMIL